jgi:hypothetical protein
MRQVLPVVPHLYPRDDWNRNFTYFCVLFGVYCSTMQGCSFHLLKLAWPWMLANLKIIYQFLAHSGDLSMSVSINITDASRDLIISVGHNITHRP